MGAEAVWKPNGTKITETDVLDMITRFVQPTSVEVSALHLDPEPRFLHLWFSHPVFEYGMGGPDVVQDDEGVLPGDLCVFVFRYIVIIGGPVLHGVERAGS